MHKNKKEQLCNTYKMQYFHREQLIKSSICFVGITRVIFYSFSQIFDTTLYIFFIKTSSNLMLIQIEHGRMSHRRACSIVALHLYNHTIVVCKICHRLNLLPFQFEKFKIEAYKNYFQAHYCRWIIKKIKISLLLLRLYKI